VGDGRTTRLKSLLTGKYIRVRDTQGGDGRCRSWRSGENPWVLNPALTRKFIIGGGGQWQRDLQEPGQQQVSVDESGMAVTSEVPCYFTRQQTVRQELLALLLALLACLVACLLVSRERLVCKLSARLQAPPC